MGDQRCRRCSCGNVWFAPPIYAGDAQAQQMSALRYRNQATFVSAGLTFAEAFERTGRTAYAVAFSGAAWMP